jgi:predicted amidohydrolase YtcJ
MTRVYRNGTVWTGIWRGGEVIVSDALAVVDGRVAALGGSALQLATRGAEVVDLEGGFLMPGFADGHAHPLKGGLATLFAPIAQETSVAGIQRAVAAWAAENPDEYWVRGEGYDPALAPMGVFDRAWLDEVVPDRPVVLRASDYHTTWVNSAALRIAGIDENTPDPPRGTIERAPMGTLREWGAWRLVDQHLPALTMAQRRMCAERAMDYLAAQGITFVQDAWVEPDDLLTWQVAPAGVRANLALLAEPESWREQVAWLASVSAELRGGQVTAESAKFLADGIIEGGTAAVIEPYCG